jgi:tRNA-dihydrouridine synthase
VPPERVYLVPIPQQGQVEPAGVFVAGINPHRAFDDAYRDFVGLCVGQIAAGLAALPGPAVPQGAELAAIVIEHYEGVLDEYGTEVGIRAARKHLDWYLEAAAIPIDKPTRLRLVESREPAEVITLIEDIFGGEYREAA